MGAANLKRRPFWVTMKYYSSQDAISPGVDSVILEFSICDLNRHSCKHVLRVIDYGDQEGSKRRGPERPTCHRRTYTPIRNSNPTATRATVVVWCKDDDTYESSDSSLVPEDVSMDCC